MNARITGANALPQSWQCQEILFLERADNKAGGSRVTEEEVIAVLKNAESINVAVWITGGWGVDALLGRQTRAHNDIDLFVQKKDAAVFTEMLRSDGFCETQADYTAKDHRCWRGANNRTIDLHLFAFADSETLSFHDEIYPSAVLDGKGTIGGMSVRCLTAEAQVLYHQGYELTEKDRHDMRLLCEAFGFSLPAEHVP